MEKNLAYAALEKIGWGRYNGFMLLQGGLVSFTQAWASFDTWFVNVGYTLKGTRAEWGLSTFEIGIIGSFFPAGLLVGSFLWGFLSDKYGRKNSFRFSGLFSTIACCILAVSVIEYMVAAALFLLGTGMAGEISLGGIFFYEFCPPSKRFYMAIMSAFLGVGAISISLIAFLTTLFNPSDVYDWRIIVGYGCCLEILALGMRLFIKETPAFLITKGKVEEAEGVLNYISRINKKPEIRLGEVEIPRAEFAQSCFSSVGLELEGQKNSQNAGVLYQKLFSAKYAKTTLSICVVRITQVYMMCSFSYSGFLYFMPELLSHFSTSQAYLIILIQQIAVVPGSLVAGWLVETRLGRKLTLAFSFVLGGVFMALLMISKDMVLVRFI